MKDITPKQIALLYVLICMLVTVVAVKYLILPANDKYKEEQQKYDTVSAEYNQLNIKSSYASIYETRNAELVDNINEMKSNFQPVIPKEDIDEIVTDLIFKNSMTTELLYINDPIEFVFEKSDTSNAGNNASEGGQAAAATTAAATTTTAATAGGTQSNAQSTQKQEQNQNVKVSLINVTVRGKYASFVKLINDIKATKGMAVYDVSFSTDEGVSPTSNIVVSLVLKIYMYDESVSEGAIGKTAQS